MFIHKPNSLIKRDGDLVGILELHRIHSPNNDIKIDVSPENPLTCWDDCGFGCEGGDPSSAWDFWRSEGILSEGTCGLHEGCQPYKFKPGEHHVNGTRGLCKITSFTPNCTKTCEDGYERS